MQCMDQQHSLLFNVEDLKMTVCVVCCVFCSEWATHRQQCKDEERNQSGQ